MTLTHQQYLDYMLHELGKTPSPTHRLVDTYNDAGRALFSAGMTAPFYHRWTWTIADNVTLPIPAGVSEVPLPKDFGGITDVHLSNRNAGSVQLVDTATLLEIRNGIQPGQLTIWLAFDVGAARQSADTTPGPVLAIYPVQPAARNDVRITYERTWPEVQSKADGTLTDPAGRPPIPPRWSRLLQLTCMKFAAEVENDRFSDVREEAYRRELESVVSFDSNRQANYGRSRHSVHRRARGQSGGYQYPHQRISRP